MRAIIGGLLLIGSAFVLPSATGDTQQPISNWLTLDQIAERVNAALPPGTRQAVVDAYFAKNHVEHSVFKKENAVYAMVPNIWGGFFPVEKGAQIVVHLSDSGIVRSVDVAAVYTGP